MSAEHAQYPAEWANTEGRQWLLLVEDRGPLRDALVGTLHTEGYDVSIAANIAETLHQLRVKQPDLVLVDLMISDGSGMEICREVPMLSPVPVIALAPVDAEAEVLRALDFGVVDYATRPLDGRALVRRIRTTLARHPRPSETHSEAVIVVGPIRIEPSRRQVSVRGVPVYLAKMEYEVLLALARRPGEILTRAGLLDGIWAGRSFEDPRTLNVHVQRIRRKIELDPGHPALLVTARGVGYCLEEGGR